MHSLQLFKNSKLGKQCNLLVGRGSELPYISTGTQQDSRKTEELCNWNKQSFSLGFNNMNKISFFLLLHLEELADALPNHKVCSPYVLDEQRANLFATNHLFVYSSHTYSCCTPWLSTTFCLFPNTTYNILTRNIGTIICI